MSLTPGCLIRVAPGALTLSGAPIRPGSVLRLEHLQQNGAALSGRILNEKNSGAGGDGSGVGGGDVGNGEAVCVAADRCRRLELPSSRPGERIFLGLEDFTAQEAGDLVFRRGDLILGEQELDPNW